MDIQVNTSTLKPYVHTKMLHQAMQDLYVGLHNRSKPPLPILSFKYL